ncbi:MAG: zinc ribbon domain-containing protein [Promethearchaeota archaeon]
MKGKISLNSTSVYCEYCGWKIPDNAIFCEKCRTELVENEFNQDRNNNINNNNDKNGSSLYEILNVKEDPVDRIINDTEYPRIFIENLILVISRLITTLVSETHDNPVRNNQDLLKNLEKELEPVMYKRLSERYLVNLHRISTTEFEKLLKELQSKLKKNPSYRRDFLVLLRCLIDEAYLIITELWDDVNLPKVKRIIRDDLKLFLIFNNSVEETQEYNIGIKYSTLYFINDLRKELQNFPESLALQCFQNYGEERH